MRTGAVKISGSLLFSVKAAGTRGGPGKKPVSLFFKWCYCSAKELDFWFYYYSACILILLIQRSEECLKDSR